MEENFFKFVDFRQGIDDVQEETISLTYLVVYILLPSIFVVIENGSLRRNR